MDIIALCFSIRMSKGFLIKTFLEKLSAEPAEVKGTKRAHETHKNFIFCLQLALFYRLREASRRSLLPLGRSCPREGGGSVPGVVPGVSGSKAPLQQETGCQPARTCTALLGLLCILERVSPGQKQMAAADGPPHLQPPLPLAALAGAGFVPEHDSFSGLSHRTQARAFQQGLLLFLWVCFSA